MQMRADLQKKEGAGFNLEEFHDHFMARAARPSKCAKALLGNDSPTL
jgi:hypothetical protein